MVDAVRDAMPAGSSQECSENSMKKLYRSTKQKAYMQQGDLELDLQPPIVAVIPPQLLPIVLHDNILNNHRVLVFASEWALDYLSRATEICIDGTYKVH